MSTSCTPFTWSSSSFESLQPSLIICSIGLVIHGLFWIQLILCPNLRQRNMMWLFVYLITDLCLLIRFFVLYAIRLASVCLYPTARDVLCYFEASSKYYLNFIQSYLLLAFNVCRYLQIVFNRNIYIERPYSIILIHCFIYIFPPVIIIAQFSTSAASIWRRRGESCDIQYRDISVQIINLFLSYIIPVVVNVIILGLCIRYVSSTKGILSEQIIVLRRKRQRTLLQQTILFYSIWIVLWSPDMLAFQFVNTNSDPSVVTSILSYVENVLDPMIIGIIDIRFLTSWKSLWHFMRRRQRQIGVVHQ